MPEFEALRERARDVKEHVLANLDAYLERYEAEVTRQGGHVHWASTAEDARRIILGICRQAGAKTITKGKSMVSEEIGLNAALEAAGHEVIETDLGEYIIQLAKEPPSHIVAPAVHKTREQVADLFDEHHRPLGYTKHLTEVGEMVDEARQVLREHYFRADVGITGGNFLIAETGSSLHRHQRGQRRPDADARPRAHRHQRHRARAADARRRGDLPAPARAQRHRPGNHRLHHAEHRA